MAHGRAYLPQALHREAETSRQLFVRRTLHACPCILKTYPRPLCMFQRQHRADF